MAMLSDKLRRVLDTRAEVCTAADNSCLMHIGGALRRQRAGVRDDAPGRDPGGAPNERGLPGRGARDARRTRSCGATSARRRRRSAPSGCARSASCPTGRRCATPARRSRRARWRRCPSSSSGWRRAVTRGRRRRCTGRATGRRRTRSSRAIARGARRARGDQGQVARHRRDRAQRGAGGARDQRDRDRPGRADRPARATTRPSHILVPAIHRNRAEIRALFERTIAEGEELGTEASRDRRGRAAAPAREVPVGAGGGLRRELRRSPRPARSASSSPRATGACARRCREVLVTVMGIEKVLPEWRDLEVFLQLLPRSSTAERMNPYTSLWTGVRARRRAAGVPPRAARRRPHRRAGRRGRPPGAALHPLLGVPERLPGLLARRRAGLRVGLSRPDRRDPHAAAARARRRRRRCRGPRRCAARATRSARSRSTSRRCSCTCAGGSCARRSRSWRPRRWR